MRIVLWLVLALLTLPPAWLLATESGLAATAIAVGRLTGGVITIRATEGRLIGEFTVHDFVYADEDVTVHLGRTTLDLRLSRLLAGRIQAGFLDVQTLAITVHDTPDDAPAPAGAPLTVRMPVWLAVERGTLRDFRIKVGEVFAWALPSAEFSARWRNEWITVGRLSALTHEAGAVEVSGRLAIRDDLLHFDRHHIRGPGQANVQGVLAIDATTENDLHVEWRELRLPEALGGGDWLHSPAGTLHLKGPWSGYAWTLEGEASVAEIPAQVAARGRADYDGVTFQRARIEALGGVIRGEGRLDWSDALSARASIDFESLNPGALAEGWDGHIHGRAAFSGQWRERVPRIEFSASLHDSQLRGYPLSLAAEGRTEAQRVMLREFSLNSGDSRLRAQGQLLPEFSLDAQFDSPDLRSLWAGLTGRAQLKARLRGTPAEPRLDLDGEGQALVYAQNRIERLRLAGRLAPAGRSDLSLQLDGVEAGVRLQTARAQLQGTRERHRLGLDLQGLDAGAQVELNGSLRDGAWNGHLSRVQVDPASGAAWRLEEPAVLTLGPDRYQLEPACVRAEGSRACLQFSGTAARQHLALRLHEFSLQHLRPWLNPDWNVQSEISGTASVDFMGGEIADVRAELSASPGHIEATGTRLDFGPGLLQVVEEGARLRARLELRPGKGTVLGDVTLGPGTHLLDRAMRGGLDVNLPDLDWLPLLSPEIASSSGALYARLAVAGTLRSPSLDGRVNIADGRVRLTTPGIELTDFSASFASSEAVPLALSVSAVSGGGTLQLDGRIDALQPRLSGRFRLHGESVQLFNTPEARIWVSPDLTLAAEGRALRLSGDIRVPRAAITPREIERTGIAPSSDQVLVSELEEAQRERFRLTSEVRIVLGNDVRFDGLGLRSRLTGGITAWDETGRPTRARGELRLEGGRYRAYGQDLIIETGRLLFVGGPVTDPVIELQAYRRPRDDILVGLRVRGRLEAPAFSLYSEPVMAQEEQLSWLVLGRSLADTLERGQQGELVGAAAGLGLAGGELLAQRFGSRLGLDEVTLGAKPGEASEMARLTVGKYLSPRLFVSYGIGLFQPGQFFRLQYDLGRNFKLAGESGVEQGGDLLYSIERGK
jgi:translocation and assembly module TamB